MKKFLIISFSAICSCTFSQSWKVYLGMNDVYCPRWDQAIQTYNFTRPWLIEKQPLIQFGAYSKIEYVFKSQSDRPWKKSLYLNYSFHSSFAENKNFINRLTFQTVTPGIGFTHALSKKVNQLNFTICAGLLLSGLKRTINDTAIVLENEWSTSFGIGVQTETIVKYDFHLAKKVISPFLNFGFTPYLFQPDAEVVLNETKGFISKPNYILVNASVAVVLGF